MPTKYTGRVMLIVFVFLMAAMVIMPPDSMFHPDGKSWRELINIRPGIDMVGGVSLIYKIQAPDVKGRSTWGRVILPSRLMEALKKRVDPQGVRNLVWRPIGTDELEIQMPLSPHSEDAPARREAYTQAVTELQATIFIRPTCWTL